MRRRCVITGAAAAVLLGLASAAASSDGLVANVSAALLPASQSASLVDATDRDMRGVADVRLQLSFMSKMPKERWAHLWLADADGGHARQLESRPGDKQTPQWSPDGSHVALRWLPKGDYSDSQLVVMSADGTRWVNLTKLTGLQGWSPSWSPDGKRLAAAAALALSQKPALYILSAEGSGVRQITNGEQEDQYAAWSPDGQLIAFSRVEAGGGFDLYTIRPDGSGLRRLTQGGGYNQWPMWSPDSRQIAFGRENGARPGIWVMNRDGSDKHFVTSKSGAGVPGTWAPATRITFQCLIPPNRRLGVCQSDDHGRQFRKLLDGREAGFPGWRKRH